MMKYVQTIWRMNSAEPETNRKSWLGSLITEMEADFPISCSFVILAEHRQRVLAWLEAKAVGPYRIEVLPDERFAVAVGTRQDAVRLRAIHWHCIDQSVVVANRSAEEIHGFIAQLKGRLAS